MRRQDRGAGQHNHVGALPAGLALRVDIGDAGGPPAGEVDLQDLRERPQVHPPGLQRPAQRDEVDRLGGDRAPVPGAEPAVVARRAAVVFDRVGRHREEEGMQPYALGPRGKEHGRALLRPGRHREGLFLWLVLLYEGGYRPDIALNPEQVLELVVVRRDVAVLERPIRHVRAGHRAEQRQSLEVDVPHPGALGVRVWECAADLVGKVVDVADEGVRRVLAGVFAKCAREGDGVRLLEVAVHPLELVVGVQRRERPVPGEVVVVVRSLLEYHDVPAGLREHHRHYRTAGARADDDRLTRHLRRPFRPSWRWPVASLRAATRRQSRSCRPHSTRAPRPRRRCSPAAGCPPET